MTIPFRYMYDLDSKLTRVALSDISSRMSENWRFKDKSISMYLDTIQVAVQTAEKSKILDYLKNGYLFGLTEENKEMKREKVKIYTDSGYYKDRKYSPLTEPLKEEVKMEKKIGRPRKQAIEEQLVLPILENEPKPIIETPKPIVETQPLVETQNMDTQNQIALGLFNTLLSKGMIKTFEISLNKNGNISFIGECELKGTK